MKTEDEFQQIFAEIMNEKGSGNVFRTCYEFFKAGYKEATDTILELANANANCQRNRFEPDESKPRDFEGWAADSAITISKLEELLGVKNERR